MMWQNRRSDQKELLDLGSAYYTKEEYTKCLELLDQINRWLGGFTAAYRACKNFACETILDVGCGSGTYCRYLHHFFPEANITGMDISDAAIAYAATGLSQEEQVKITFEQKKLLDYSDNSFEIVTSMLVCHHMNDEEVVNFLKECSRISSKAVIINDLQRHFLAYLSFLLVMPFFPNRLIWHDGPLSIKRSFRKKEWKKIFIKAGFQKNQILIRWNWAFRWTITIRK